MDENPKSSNHTENPSQEGKGDLWFTELEILLQEDTCHHLICGDN